MIDLQRLLKFCKIVISNKKFKLENVNKNYLTSLKSEKICFFMHGTSGFSKNCINYMKMLHKLGFVIIAPHHVSYHRYLCNIYKQTKICGTHIKFNTTHDFAKKNRIIYKYITEFRKNELEKCFDFFKTYINLNNTIAVGVSEGGVAVSIAKLPKVTKFVCSYSIERNYFTRKFPVVHLYKNQNIVQIIGTNDQYFGPCSISSSLRKKITGNGFCTFKRCKLKNFTIYLIKGEKHSLLETKRINRDLISEIIYSHFGAKQKRISPKFATLYFKISG
jgi:hypothetical protein